MFNSTAWSVSIIQFSTTLFALLGLMFFHVTAMYLIVMLIGYFLFSCVGISVFYHRYISHKSFKTNKIIEHIGMALGILAGRGSPMGWVSVHRTHHKHADDINDPHLPNWKIFVPHLMEYKGSPYTIRDLIFSKYHRFVDKYYNLIILSFVLALGLLDSRLLLFFWIIPVALTAWALNLFVYLSHTYGYKNFDTKDNSKNNWFISLILWGEGWHNNHHCCTKWWNLHVKWWEIDISAWVIRLIGQKNEIYD